MEESNSDKTNIPPRVRRRPQAVYGDRASMQSLVAALSHQPQEQADEEANVIMPLSSEPSAASSVQPPLVSSPTNRVPPNPSKFSSRRNGPNQTTESPQKDTAAFEMLLEQEGELVKPIEMVKCATEDLAVADKFVEMDFQLRPAYFRNGQVPQRDCGPVKSPLPQKGRSLSLINMPDQAHLKGAFAEQVRETKLLKREQSNMELRIAELEDKNAKLEEVLVTTRKQRNEIAPANRKLEKKLVETEHYAADQYEKCQKLEQKIESLSVGLGRERASAERARVHNSQLSERLMVLQEGKESVNGREVLLETQVMNLQGAMEALEREHQETEAKLSVREDEVAVLRSELDKTRSWMEMSRHQGQDMENDLWEADRRAGFVTQIYQQAIPEKTLADEMDELDENDDEFEKWSATSSQRFYSPAQTRVPTEVDTATQTDIKTEHSPEPAASGLRSSKLYVSKGVQVDSRGLMVYPGIINPQGDEQSLKSTHTEDWPPEDRDTRNSPSTKSEELRKAVVTMVLPEHAYLTEVASSGMKAKFNSDTDSQPGTQSPGLEYVSDDGATQYTYPSGNRSLVGNSASQRPGLRVKDNNDNCPRGTQPRTPVPYSPEDWQQSKSAKSYTPCGRQPGTSADRDSGCWQQSNPAKSYTSSVILFPTPDGNRMGDATFPHPGLRPEGNDIYPTWEAEPQNPLRYFSNDCEHSQSSELTSPDVQSCRCVPVIEKAQHAGATPYNNRQDSTLGSATSDRSRKYIPIIEQVQYAGDSLPYSTQSYSTALEQDNGSQRSKNSSSSTEPSQNSNKSLVASDESGHQSKYGKSLSPDSVAGPEWELVSPTNTRSFAEIKAATKAGKTFAKKFNVARSDSKSAANEVSATSETKADEMGSDSGNSKQHTPFAPTSRQSSSTEAKSSRSGLGDGSTPQDGENLRRYPSGSDSDANESASPRSESEFRSGAKRSSINSITNQSYHNVYQSGSLTHDSAMNSNSMGAKDGDVLREVITPDYDIKEPPMFEAMPWSLSPSTSSSGWRYKSSGASCAGPSLRRPYVTVSTQTNLDQNEPIVRDFAKSSAPKKMSPNSSSSSRSSSGSNASTDFTNLTEYGGLAGSWARLALMGDAATQNETAYPDRPIQTEAQVPAKHEYSGASTPTKNLIPSKQSVSSKGTQTLLQKLNFSATMPWNDRWLVGERNAMRVFHVSNRQRKERMSQSDWVTGSNENISNGEAVPTPAPSTLGTAGAENAASRATTSLQKPEDQRRPRKGVAQSSTRTPTFWDIVKPKDMSVWTPRTWYYTLWAIILLSLAWQSHHEKNLWRSANKLKRQEVMSVRDDYWSSELIAKMNYRVEKIMDIDRDALG